MDRVLLVGAVALAALSGEAIAAQVYRCTSVQGSVSYQEQPCGGVGQERAIAIADFPAVNTAERERLLQREAALEARLLKRAEIESAERMARDERKARELELQAERERAAAAAAAQPLYVIPIVVRPHRYPHHRPASLNRY